MSERERATIAPTSDVVTMLTHAEFIIENMSTLIRETRRLRKQSVAEVCRRTGLSPATINRLEAGTVVGDVRTSLRMIKWLLND